MNDIAAKYDNIKNQIKALEDELINIKQEVANYKIPFGKYKGQTLAQIAHKDLRYYQWLKSKNVIPYTINFDINIYITTCIQDKIQFEIIKEEHDMKEKQGFAGRYDI